MRSRRTLARSVAVAGAVALLVGPMAGGAQAAARKKTPTPTITQKPPAVTNAQSATLGFTDTNAAATFTCSLDGAPYRACTSPKTYSGLAAGAHVFRVRATATGLTQSNAASTTWSIDLTPPPAPSLNGVPASPTASTGATLSFTDTEAGVTFACSLDGATATACTSPQTLTALGEGAHTFEVTARDAAGNVGPAATGGWTIDVTPPPAPTVNAGPADPTNQTGATFTVSDTDATAILTCSLDGGAYAACGPTATYSGLAEQAHTFDVKAADSLGNAASAPQYTWTVDLTSPTPPTILTNPPVVSNNPVGSFTFTLPADATSLRCSVDSTTDYAACGTSFSTGTLTDGSHTVRVVARDAATNDSGATPYTWTVDTVAPPAPGVSGPPALTNATSAAFTLTDAASPVTYTCALDGGTATTCASGVSYGPLAPGPHSLVVTAVDAAGNTTAAPAYAWTIDTAAPTVTIAAPATLTGPARATFSEPVKGVGAASYVLRVAGTLTPLPASVSCSNAAANAVSCATGPVKTARVTAAKPLVPGQQYVVTANPASAATITDLAGNSLVTTAKPFRALRVVQDNGVGPVYGWRAVANSAAYGGSYRTEHTTRTSASYKFSGTSVTWYTITGRNQGKADVLVDGVRKATVNNYASTTRYKVARTVSGLGAGAHTLKIVVLGVKGSTSGTGTWVAVDAVKVGTTVTANPTLTYAWRVVPANLASGGTLTLTDATGAATSLVFRGTAISLWTSTGRNRGKAKLYVDGVLKATYDLYAAATTYNVRRTVTGLADGVHTVRLVVTGTRRAAATGTLVPVDRWSIA